MEGTTRASSSSTYTFGSSTVTAQSQSDVVALLLKVIQEVEDRKASDDSNRQTAPESVKGKAKRTASAAGNAPLEPSAKRSRTTQATQTYPNELPAAGQPMQQSGKASPEVDGIIYIDVKPPAASDLSAIQAQQGQPNAQAMQVHDPEPHAARNSRGKQAKQGQQIAQTVQVRAPEPHAAPNFRGKQAQLSRQKAQAVRVHGSKPHDASACSGKQEKAQAVQKHGPKLHAGSGPKRKKAQQTRQKVKAERVDGPKPPAASEPSGKQAQQKVQAACAEDPKPRSGSRARGKKAQAQAKPRAGSGPGRKQAQRAQQEAQAVPAKGHGHDAQAVQARRFGNHFGDRPHRLTIGGENPSKWTEGRPRPKPYGNPNNKFWKTAKEAGIVTADLADEEEYDKDKMLEQVSFVDIKLVSWASGVAEGDDFRTPGGKNNIEWFRQHMPACYVRLEEHMARASDSIKCTCGECGAPAFFVWNGKYAWENLLKIGGIKVKKGGVKYGLQTRKPKDWPLPEQTQVWVLPNTSGANVSFNDGGQAWWVKFGEVYRARFVAEEWPWKPKCY